MTSPDHAAWLLRLQRAKEAALLAGEKILAHYNPQGTSLAVQYKSPHQPVTKADLDANTAIRETLSEFFSEDAWLSEEDPDTENRFSKKNVWVIDPLDGTRDFILGRPEFAVSIGCLRDNQPVLGVIYNPVTRELFWALQGQGAYFQEMAEDHLTQKNPPQKIFVRDQDLVTPEILVSRSEYERHEWDVLDWPVTLIPRGGSAYKLALIAQGVAHAALTFVRKSEWDICAGAAIVKEAGAVITDVRGEPLVFNKKPPLFSSVLYAHPQIHRQILKFIEGSSL